MYFFNGIFDAIRISSYSVALEAGRYVKTTPSLLSPICSGRPQTIDIPLGLFVGSVMVGSLCDCCWVGT